MKEFGFPTRLVDAAKYAWKHKGIIATGVVLTLSNTASAAQRDSLPAVTGFGRAIEGQQKSLITTIATPEPTLAPHDNNSSGVTFGPQPHDRGLGGYDNRSDPQGWYPNGSGGWKCDTGCSPDGNK